MNLREQLLKEHTKENKDRIVQWIGRSQKRFDELFTLFLTDEYRVVQRASWALSYAVDEYPTFIQPHFKVVIKNLHKKGIPDAVKRNTLRFLQDIDIPEAFQGEMMTLCFDYITDPKEKAAVKAFSLTVLENMLAHYPEIGQEIKTIIDTQWDQETPAFHSRARKLLKKLYSFCPSANRSKINRRF